MSDESRAAGDARATRRFPRVRAALAVLCALGALDAELPRGARAQHRIETIVVEATRLPSDERLETDADAKQRLDRTPGGVEQVDEEEIRETRTSNLRDALEFVPGVLVRPRFGSEEAQLSIRGSGLRNNFHLRGLNLLLNGFAYGSADGFSDFESLELLSVKRIEIYKGANALRRGTSRSASISSSSARAARLPGPRSPTAVRRHRPGHLQLGIGAPLRGRSAAARTGESLHDRSPVLPDPAGRPSVREPRR